MTPNFDFVAEKRERASEFAAFGCDKLLGKPKNIIFLDTCSSVLSVCVSGLSGYRL